MGLRWARARVAAMRGVAPSSEDTLEGPSDRNTVNASSSARVVKSSSARCQIAPAVKSSSARCEIVKARCEIVACVLRKVGAFFVDHARRRGLERVRTPVVCRSTLRR